MHHIAGVSPAKALLSANTAINVERSQRLNKQQAQTITGVSQRPAVVNADTAYWESVKATEVGAPRVGRL